jgi:hypothetical protein
VLVLPNARRCQRLVATSPVLGMVRIRNFDIAALRATGVTESLKNFLRNRCYGISSRGVQVRGGQARIDRNLPNIDSVPAARSQSRDAGPLTRWGRSKHCAEVEFGRFLSILA